MKVPSKNKVLIITYYWPPSGGAAVQRWLSFSNHLSELGFDVYVLTVSEETASYPLLDESLVEKIDSNIHVFRTNMKDLSAIYKKYIGKGKVPSAGFANEGKPNYLQLVARFIRGNFFLPDPRKSWNKTAVPKALQLIHEHKIETVITAGPPHSTHLIGRNLKEMNNSIYWIADFHDAWTDVWYYDKLFRTRPIVSLDRKMERSILEQADHVLVVGSYLKKVLASKIDSKNDKFSVISMGYNDEIDQLKNQEKNTHFTITYTGTIGVEYNPQIVFIALKKLLSENPSYQIKLRFVGILSAAIRDSIIDNSLGEILEETGYVSHQKSINYLVQSDSLLLISPKVKSEKIIIPGKLYEYLATQKPIINIGHLETDTARIVTLCNAGKNFNRDQVEELLTYIKHLYKLWENNNDLISNEGKDVTYQSFRRSNEAKKVASLIKSRSR